jgi:translation initiation factor 3 subunit G
MAAAATTNKLQTMRWSDLDEDDDYGGGGDLSTLLPPRVVIGPDENGIRRVPLQRGGESGEGDHHHPCP